MEHILWTHCKKTILATLAFLCEAFDTGDTGYKLKSVVQISEFALSLRRDLELTFW